MSRVADVLEQVLSQYSNIIALRKSNDLARQAYLLNENTLQKVVGRMPLALPLTFVAVWFLDIRKE
ncbi:hypothetical protein M1146_07085 [Patescibacteria group bacterium]|nr:hypothetical protein [Patescibacteria group bacterium]